MMTRHAWALSLALMMMTTGCVGLPGPVERAPRHAGPSPVGVVTVEVEDEVRGRQLPVEIWYPAAPSDADPTMYRVRGGGGVTVARVRSALGARRAVPLAQSSSPYPVVLISHGAGSSRYGHATLAEVLASHGYVVAAPDHVGHTVADHTFGISLEDRAQAAMDRPIDLSRVLDDLLARHARKSSIFHRALDPSRVAVAGHSFGGRSALAISGASFDGARQSAECVHASKDRRCHAVGVFGAKSYRYRDPRVRAALLIAPSGYAFYRGDGVSRINVPTLVVGAERDRTTPYAEFHAPVFEALAGPKHFLPLRDAGHLTATDVCEIVGSIGMLARWVGGERAVDGCNEGFLAPRDAIDLVTAAALPFLRRYLDDDPSAESPLHRALSANTSLRRRIAAR